MTRKTSKILSQIASELEKTGNTGLGLTSKLTEPEHLAGPRIFMYKLMKRLALTNIYWNGMLKKNKAWKNRNDSPLSVYLGLASILPGNIIIDLSSLNIPSTAKPKILNGSRNNQIIGYRINAIKARGQLK